MSRNRRYNLQSIEEETELHLFEEELADEHPPPLTRKRTATASSKPQKQPKRKTTILEEDEELVALLKQCSPTGRGLHRAEPIGEHQHDERDEEAVGGQHVDMEQQQPDQGARPAAGNASPGASQADDSDAELSQSDGEQASGQQQQQQYNGDEDEDAIMHDLADGKCERKCVMSSAIVVQLSLLTYLLQMPAWARRAPPTAGRRRPQGSMRASCTRCCSTWASSSSKPVHPCSSSAGHVAVTAVQ